MSQEKWNEVFASSQRSLGDRLDGPRASLQQLKDAGLGVEILEEDQFGPVLLKRRSMNVTIWRRVSGRGADARYQLIETISEGPSA